MKPIRARLLAFVFSLLLLPVQLLFSAPAAAVTLPTSGRNVGFVGFPGKFLAQYMLDGLVDFGSLSPGQLRLDIYDAGGHQIASTTDGSLSLNWPVSCDTIPGDWMWADSVLDIRAIRSAPTCASYHWVLNAPGTYRIHAMIGGDYEGVQAVSTDAAVPVWFFYQVIAPVIPLSRTVVNTPPAAPPKPTPVPPSLAVTPLPTTTDASYFVVSGTATEGAAVRVEVGGHEASTYNVGQAGTFGIGATLVPGENKLHVVATKDGLLTSFDATVTQAPKPAEPKAPEEPMVTVTTPVVPTPPISVLPENAVSRAEFAQMLVRAFHLPDAGPLTLEAPNGPITRAEAALVAAKALRLAGIQSSPATLSFTDAAAIPYPTDVALAVGAGLATGLADGSFHPIQNLTRAEATTIVERAVTLMGH